MKLAATIVCLVAIGLPSSAAGQIPQTFTNLQVLPKDIARGELVMTMRRFTSALGVRCTHCHVGPDDLQGMDFATDEKRTKQIARTMLRMVQAVNRDVVSKLPGGAGTRQPVTCITCHRREMKPPRPLPDLLVDTIASRGVPAAVEQYRTLRAESLDAGLYDFREHSLNIAATALREQKKFDEALALLQLNAEMFPKSAMVQINLGDTAQQKGDLAGAAAAYTRALEIEPGNPVAAKALAALKRRD